MKPRLFLRLTAELNDQLRELMRHYGEFSGYIEEALTSSDLRSIELAPDWGGRSRGITAVISHPANGRLRSVTSQRGCTVKALANSASKEWLGGHNAR